MSGRGESGQATLLLVWVLVAVAAAALLLGGVARGIGAGNDRQRAADLAALSAARAMHARFARLFGGGAPMDVASYKAAAERAARTTARRNGMQHVRVTFPDGDSFAPVRVRVVVTDAIAVGEEEVPHRATADAELAPPADVAFADGAGAGEYSGPLATRQGKRMRPDVAVAFDRMHAAATKAGVPLTITSGYRSNAEQAVLFARNPDPRWVAPPGKSLHRLGTELDLGPPAAYGWLAASAPRFGFIKRYSWEPWHFGYARNAGSSSVGYGKGGRATGKGSLVHGDQGGGASDGERSRSLPSFVPTRFAPMISKAAQRWNVGAALLAAQIYAESNFNPYARSSAGAQGIAQFMPGTAAAYGLKNPFDAEAAINAQAHLMRDLLRQFGAVPLALAAYNAGPAPVQRCGCVPPYPETRGYVAKILGLLGGAGDLPTGGGLEVRLVA